MSDQHEFDGVLFKGGDVANASFFIEVPAEIVAAFGKKGHVKVKGTMDGTPYRTSFVPRDGRQLLTVRKEIREAVGKTSGDTLHITVEADTETRVVDVPQDVAQALAAQGTAQAFFDQLSFSHQKEFMDWITGAKKAETRQRRIEKMIEMLGKGVKTPRDL